MGLFTGEYRLFRYVLEQPYVDMTERDENGAEYIYASLH